MTFKVKAGLTVNNTIVINANGHVVTSANNANNLGGQAPSYYTNATNISTGTLDNARLNTANTTAAGIVQLTDQTNNTSITVAPTANALAAAYSLASTANAGLATAYSNATSYADTKAAAAYSNATSYADTKAAAAFSNAVSYADTKSSAAYSNAIAYADTKSSAAYANATAFAANASNITTGTLPNARLTSATTSGAGIVQLSDSVTSTSVTQAATANSVKRAYDSATAAYANAIAASVPKTGTDTVAAQLTFSNTIVFSGGIVANGSLGGAGYYLTSNGTSVYWYQQPTISLDNVLAVGNVSTKSITVNNATITGTLTVDGGDYNIRVIDTPAFNGTTTTFTLTVNGNTSISPVLTSPEQLLLHFNDKVLKPGSRRYYNTGVIFNPGVVVASVRGDYQINSNGSITFTKAWPANTDFDGRLLNTAQMTNSANVAAPTSSFTALAIALDNY